MTVGERLKQLRESLGKSATNIAKIANVSARQWLDYEAGKNMPGGKVIDALAHLGVNINWVFTGVGPVFIEGYPPEIFKPGQFPEVSAWQVAKGGSQEAKAIGERIGKISESFGGIKRLTAAVGSSGTIIEKMRLGKIDVPYWILFKIADVSGVTIRWLVTGEGLIRSPEKFVGQAVVDQDLLKEIMETVEEIIAEQHLSLRPAKKAQLVTTLYDHFAAKGQGVDRGTVLKFVRLAT